MIHKNPGFRPAKSQFTETEPCFANPIGEWESPDPFVTYDSKFGRYYLLFTRGKEVRIFYADRLSDLRRDENSVKVYGIEQGDGITGCIWAPEMHKFGDRWYIYTSGARTPDGREDRTLFILKSKTENPLDGFTFECYPEPTLHAIDPTVYTHTDGCIYMCYAREKDGNRIHIRKMASPTAFDGESVLLCEAELPWEMVPPYVGNSTIVEGPYFVKSPDGGRLFVLYSANGCWSDDYAFGVLEYKGGDLVCRENWEKDPDVLMKKGNGTYGPGHASFFYAPNGKDLYIAYHSMHEPNQTVTWAPRFLHIQRVYFDEIGYPYIGEPVPMGKTMKDPE